jgi:hypothetical protein
MATNTAQVFEVLYDTGTDGRMGDGFETFRARNAKDAQSFANGRTCYGKPATVEALQVPRRIAQRWGMA